MDQLYHSAPGAGACTAKARLIPNVLVDKYISVIPRTACMVGCDQPFRINPETARVICSCCGGYGHVKQYCQNTQGKRKSGESLKGAKHTHLEACNIPLARHWVTSSPLIDPVIH